MAPGPSEPPSIPPVPEAEVAAGPVRHVPQKPHIADRFSLWAVHRIRRVKKAAATLGRRIGTKVARLFGYQEQAEEGLDLGGVDADRLSILRAVADRKRAPRVLFVDGTNGARSMACEAYAITLGLYAESAGPFPAPTTDDTIAYVLKERQLDISAWRPKILIPTRMDAFDRVVILGDAVPEGLVRHPNVERWSVPLDPKGFPTEGYRLVRDQAERQVRRLARRLAGMKTRRKGNVPEGMQPKSARRLGADDPSVTRGPAPPAVSLNSGPNGTTAAAEPASP